MSTTNTLNYIDLKREFREKAMREKNNRRRNTQIDDTQDYFKGESKIQNEERRQDFWEYLARCPIKN